VNARLRRAALPLAIATLGLAGCKEVAEESASGYEPAKVQGIKGRDDVKLVTLTAEGARRVGLQTAAVGRSGARRVVPYAAVIYDAEGKTYVYRSTAQRSFVRDEVKVDRIVRDRALLSRGPAPGATVVTTGAAEVYGTELDVAGSH